MIQYLIDNLCNNHSLISNRETEREKNVPRIMTMNATTEKTTTTHCDLVCMLASKGSPYFIFFSQLRSDTVNIAYNPNPATTIPN